MITAELFKTLEAQGNFDTIAHIALDISTRIGTHDPAAEADMAAFKDYLKTLEIPEKGETISEKQKDAFDKLLGAFSDICGEAVFEAETEIKNAEPKILNGEIDELSLAVADERSARKAAEQYAYSQTKAGTKLQAVYVFFNALQEVSVLEGADNSLTNKIYNKMTSAVKPALENGPLDYKEDELNNSAFLESRIKCETSKVDGFLMKTTPIEAGESLFDRVNDNELNIKKYSDQKLADEIKEKKILAEKAMEDKKTLKAISDDAKKLYEEISAVEGIDKGSKLFILLESQIENMTKFGTDEFAFVMDGSILDEPKFAHTNVVNPRGYKMSLDTFNTVLQSYKAAYEGQDTPEAKAAMQVTEKAQRFFDEHTKVYENIKNNAAYKDPAAPEKELKILEREQSNRLNTNKTIENLKNGCHTRDRDINIINDYLYSVQRGLDMITKGMKFMDSDSKTHKSPSDSYTEFAESMNELSNLKPENTSPQEVIEKLRTAYNAASRYETKHTGWKHPFTGYSDNGKDRIRYSSLAKEILGQKIEELTAKGEKIDKLLYGNTPGKAVTELEKDNKTAREKVKAERAKLKAAQEKENKQSKAFSLDEKLKMSQGKIVGLKVQAGEKEKIKKEDLFAPCVRIISAINLKRVEKKTNKPVDEKTFNAQVKIMEKNKSVTKLFEMNTPEKLYDMATKNGGAGLYNQYYDIFKTLNSDEPKDEIKTEPKQEIKNDKNLTSPQTGMVKK